MSTIYIRIDHGQPGVETSDGYLRMSAQDPAKYRMVRTILAPGGGVFGVYRRVRWWNRRKETQT